MPVAVVTGAGGGLGRAIALELAQRGFLVHVTDVDPDAAARVAVEIGAGARSAALDVRDEAACRALAGEAVTRGGTLDLWVNNAGVLVTGASWTQDEATRRTMLEINTLGTMNGTIAALEPMLSAVCPDGIWTPMLEDKLDDPDAAGSFSGHLLTAEQVASAVGKLTEHPRPILILPRWRGLQLRLLNLFPRLTVRVLGFAMRDARRKQRRYKRRIEAGKWPK
jgi:short chain dehydrogenase